MRPIDADALTTKHYLMDQDGAIYGERTGVTFNEIENAPTIALERKKGKWHQNDNGTWTCSQCQAWIPDEQHYYARYCLYCGAEMGEGIDDVSNC